MRGRIKDCKSRCYRCPVTVYGIDVTADMASGSDSVEPDETTIDEEGVAALPHSSPAISAATAALSSV